MFLFNHLQAKAGGKGTMQLFGKYLINVCIVLNDNYNIMVDILTFSCEGYILLLRVDILKPHKAHQYLGLYVYGISLKH